MSPAHPAPSVEPALHVRGLSHAFGTRQALDQVEICVVPGEFKVLLGPNGAGKTTLFALASGLFRADAGEIVVFGQALSRAPAACLSKIGMVFQQPSLDLDLSVSENLRYHGALHGLSPAETDARSSETLARLDLADRRKDSVRELNGGHRRRLELARALVHRPRLLLLDEPTVGLDIESRADIVDHTHRLASEDGVAVLWATHLIDEVRAGDSLMILHQGRKAADGSCADVIETAGAGNIADAYSILTRKADGATQ